MTTPAEALRQTADTLRQTEAALRAAADALAAQAVLYDSVLDPEPEPEPEPPVPDPALDTVDELVAQWDLDWAKAMRGVKLPGFYTNTATTEAEVYFLAYEIRAQGAVACALDEPPRWESALKAATAQLVNAVPVKDGMGWMKANSAGVLSEYVHQETLWGGAVGWLLWEMQQRAMHTTPAYEARWVELRDFVVMLLTKWWNRSASHGDLNRVIVHILANSVKHLEFAARLDGVDLPFLAEARDLITHRWLAYLQAQPDGIFDQDMTGGKHSGLPDFSHQQFNVETALLLNRADHTFWPGAQQYWERTFWRCWVPAAGKFTENVDGSGGIEWPHVALPGWTTLGAGSAEVQLALQARAGDSYPWHRGIMAENAARLGVG